MISTARHAAAFVRQYAHARITGIDASSALDMDGTVAVYALDDLREHLTDTVMPVEQPSGALKQSASPSVLADGEVDHVANPWLLDARPPMARKCRRHGGSIYDTLAVSADYLGALADGAPKAPARCPTTWSPDSLCPTAIPMAFNAHWETPISIRAGAAIECRGVLRSPGDHADG